MGLSASLEQIATQFFRRALLTLPSESEPIDWESTKVACWQSHAGRTHGGRLVPVPFESRYTLDDVLGVERQKAELDLNTRQFLQRLPANNALLWGPRGTGKSSLVKAIIATYHDQGLRLIEVNRHDLANLAAIADAISSDEHRFIIYCDDLSFENDDEHYKALKVALDGGIRETPSNLLIYATSNRRHLMPEPLEDNQGTSIVETEIHYADAVEERISLSDRFGLWLAFHPFTQDLYLRVVCHWLSRLGHAEHQDLPATLRADALRYALERGSRSGRTAFQFAKKHVGASRLTDA